MIRINNEIQKVLLSLPESGLGYQLIEATIENNEKKVFIILNAEYAIPINNIAYLQDESFITNAINSYKEVAVSMDKTNAVEFFFTEIKLIKKIPQKVKRGIKKEPRYLVAAGVKKPHSTINIGAINALLEYTEIGEKFIRFSPYEDDKRIDKYNMKVLPGTFATTYDDGINALKKGLDIIEYYALPSPQTICYAFYIEPLKNTPIKRGIAQINFGHRGGGEEVIFTDGTHNNTIIKIEKL